MGNIEQVVLEVDGEAVEIYVAKRGKSTWFAYGTYRGKRHDASGSSRSNALDKWKTKVDYLAKD